MESIEIFVDIHILNYCGILISPYDKSRNLPRTIYAI